MQTRTNFGHAIVVIGAALLFAVSASSGIAQAISPSDQASLQQALKRGQRLYAFDQAAWKATDALQADAKARGQFDALASRLGGWIVREAEPDTLEVLFFDKTFEKPKPLYVARLTENGSNLVSGQLVGDDAPAIDAVTLRMIRARQSALDAIAGQNLLRCAKGSYNTAVLPPETPDGAIPVYILTPQSDLHHVPFGGHSRIMVDADGKAGPIHAFTRSCLNFPTQRAKDAPKALVATQLLDPLPTEIGIFTMFAAGLPLYVGTPDGRQWELVAPGGQASIQLLPDQNK